MIIQAYRIKTISQRHRFVQLPRIYLMTLDEEVLLIQPDACEVREQPEGVHKLLLCQRAHCCRLDTMRLRQWGKRKWGWRMITGFY